MHASNNRIEQSLREWEDVCFMVGLGVKMSAVGVDGLTFEGPLKHWAGLRKYLLTYKRGEFFDHERFLGPTGVQRQLMPIQLLPLALTSWTTSSRRIFHLSSDLQALLEGTSLGDLTFGDVTWPFDSFVVALESPIRDPHGNTYDCILVSKGLQLVEKSDTLVEFRMFSTDLETHRRLTWEQKRWFEEALTHHRVKRMKELLRRHLVCAQPTVSSLFTLEQNSDCKVVESVAETVQRRSKAEGMEFVPWGRNPPGTPSPHWDKAVQIIVGLCAYLTTIGSGHHQDRSDWERLPAGPDSGAITNTAEVCAVKASHLISPSEGQELRDALDQEQVEMGGTRSHQAVRSHYRRGHWRKLPGQGNNPGAQKLVHVRPTIVRKDRLPEGGVPGGSESIVK